MGPGGRKSTCRRNICACKEIKSRQTGAIDGVPQEMRAGLDAYRRQRGRPAGASYQEAPDNFRMRPASVSAT
jgi:hypothetical protein